MLLIMLYGIYFVKHYYFSINKENIIVINEPEPASHTTNKYRSKCMIYSKQLCLLRFSKITFRIVL